MIILKKPKLATNCDIRWCEPKVKIDSQNGVIKKEEKITVIYTDGAKSEYFIYETFIRHLPNYH